MRPGLIAVLALAAAVALAQTSPNSGGPKFMDYGTLVGQTPGNAPRATNAGGAQNPLLTPAGTRNPPLTAPGKGTLTTATSATGTEASTNATASMPANLSGYVPDDKYKLRQGDKVAFQILEDREAPKSLVVADSGELDLPYVGRVAAADKTCKQLADELKALLEKEYYYRATVIIALDVANKYLGRIYVWGQVR